MIAHATKTSTVEVAEEHWFMWAASRQPSVLIPCTTASQSYSQQLCKGTVRSTESQRLLIPVREKEKQEKNQDHRNTTYLENPNRNNDLHLKSQLYIQLPVSCTHAERSAVSSTQQLCVYQAGGSKIFIVLKCRADQGDQLSYHEHGVGNAYFWRKQRFSVNFGLTVVCKLIAHSWCRKRLVFMQF